MSAQLLKKFQYLAITSKTNGEEIELTNDIAELHRKKNNDEEKIKLKTALEKQEIKHLLHFTPIKNLKQILKFGILPRDFLEIPCVNKIIMPTFPDQKRMDGHRDSFCVSVSWPNYKMLSFKSNRMDTEWVILKISLKHIEENKCIFFKTNAASFKSRQNKDNTFDQMFYNDDNIRDELNLENYFTTDPQAEVLSSSQISPKWIEALYFKDHSQIVKHTVINLTKQNLLNGIKSIYGSDFFEPRKDFKYWQK